MANRAATSSASRRNPKKHGGPRSGKRPKQRGRPPVDGDAQRDKILSAAIGLFITRGFAETTIDAVVQAAGVTKRTIYQHVGNKDAMFRIICKERLPLAAHMRFEIDLEGSSLSEIVTAMARRLLEATLAPEAIALQRMIVTEGRRFPQLVEEVITDGMRTLNGNIAAIFSELVDLRQLAPLDTARAADLLYDIVIGNRAFRLTMGHGETMPDDRELLQRVDTFIYGHLLRAGNTGGTGG